MSLSTLTSKGQVSLDVNLMINKKFVPEAVIRDYLCERHFLWK